MDSLKLPELKQLAKERGIAGFSKMKRQQLIAVLSEVKIEVDEKKNEDKQVVEPECDGGVCLLKLPEEKPKKNKKNKDVIDSVVQEYLNAIMSVPVSTEIVDKMAKTRLIEIGKQLGIQSINKMSKLEIFQNIIKVEIQDLLKEL